MKILYLITGLRMGGAEKQLSILTKHMLLAGYDVMVVAMESGGVVAEEIRNNGVPVSELGIGKVPSLFSGYKKFKSIVKTFSPTIIHSHMIHANLFARFYKLFNPGIKIISTAHNIREGNSALMQGYRLTSAIPNWSTNVSREAYEYFVQHKYFNGQNSCCIPNAIDVEAYNFIDGNANLTRKSLSIADDKYVFLTSGRLHGQKNQQLLLRAFKQVKETIKDAVLVIVGEGPLERELKALSETLEIADDTYFLGRRNDMPALMNMCDCFVLTSIFEGFGMVVGEAMVAKKPVIATDCGGVKEVMGGFGRLIANNDLLELVKVMTAVCQQPDIDDYLAAAQKHIEDNYAIPQIVEQWRQLYHKEDL